MMCSCRPGALARQDRWRWQPERQDLAATLGVCTAAAAGAAVHAVTVNDYLAEQDAEDNIPLYARSSVLTVGVVKRTWLWTGAGTIQTVVYVSSKN